MDRACTSVKITSRELFICELPMQTFDDSYTCTDKSSAAVKTWKRENREFHALQTLWPWKNHLAVEIPYVCSCWKRWSWRLWLCKRWSNGPPGWARRRSFIRPSRSTSLLSLCHAADCSQLSPSMIALIIEEAPAALRRPDMQRNSTDSPDQRVWRIKGQTFRQSSCRRCSLAMDKCRNRAPCSTTPPRWPALSGKQHTCNVHLGKWLWDLAVGMPDSHSLSKTWSALLAERAAGGSGIWKVSSSASLVCSLDLALLGGGPSGSTLGSSWSSWPVELLALKVAQHPSGIASPWTTPPPVAPSSRHSRPLMGIASPWVWPEAQSPLLRLSHPAPPQSRMVGYSPLPPPWKLHQCHWAHQLLQLLLPLAVQQLEVEVPSPLSQNGGHSKP